MHRLLLLLSLAVVVACGDDGHAETDTADAAAEPGPDPGPGPCVGDACGDLYVATDGTGEACTAAAPCGKIQTALVERTATRNTIHIAPGRYVESVVVRGDLDATLLGEGVDLSPGRDTSALNVLGHMHVRVVGVDIHGGRGAGDGLGVGVYCTAGDIRKQGPSLTLDRVTIHDNAGVGLVTFQCDVVVNRSTIRHNRGGGASLDGYFIVLNTYIVDNGAQDNPDSEGGLDAPGWPNSVFEFNTVANNWSQSAGAGVRLRTALPVSDNLVFGNRTRDGKISEVNLGVWTYSRLGGDASPAGEGNALMADAHFVDAAHGDYRLAAGSPAVDAADPHATLDIDNDGTARPSGAGRDIGADELR